MITVGRILLWLSAMVFAGIGAVFLTAPVSWARVVEIELPTPMARTDLRATYGGFCLAFGAFLAICALNPVWLRPGLLASGLALLGFGLARFSGIVIERQGHRLMWIFLILELIVAALSLVSYARLGQV